MQHSPGPTAGLHRRAVGAEGPAADQASEVLARGKAARRQGGKAARRSTPQWSAASAWSFRPVSARTRRRSTEKIFEAKWCRSPSMPHRDCNVLKKKKRLNPNEQTKPSRLVDSEGVTVPTELLTVHVNPSTCEDPAVSRGFFLSRESPLRDGRAGIPVQVLSAPRPSTRRPFNSPTAYSMLIHPWIHRRAAAVSFCSRPKVILG